MRGATSTRAEHIELRSSSVLCHALDIRSDVHAKTCFNCRITVRDESRVGPLSRWREGEWSVPRLNSLIDGPSSVGPFHRNATHAAL